MPGLAQRGKAELGKVRILNLLSNETGPGTACRGMERRGLAWQGKARILNLFSNEELGKGIDMWVEARRGEARHGLARPGRVRHGKVFFFQKRR